MSTAAHETSLGLDHRKVAIWAFLGSEFLFFGAFISSFLLYQNDVNEGPGVELFDIPFTSVSSFVLLMSSVTMVLAHSAHVRGDMRRMRLWVLATAFQGMVFIGGQVFEFTTFVKEGMAFTTSPFSSAFFALTGFHGAHVTVGILMLLSLAGLTKLDRVKPDQHIKTEMIGLYWHFVDIIWIIIFTVVYLIPAG
ncbi:MAG: cytochrome c oxidase subunit 3 [Actinobacteria bacterium]|nr:cytochrome c oxidase subunit 3 [Actinomycetota bacterium]